MYPSGTRVAAQAATQAELQQRGAQGLQIEVVAQTADGSNTRDEVAQVPEYALADAGFAAYGAAPSLAPA